MNDLTRGAASGDALEAAELRHLLRRFAFSATPSLERQLQGLPADEALRQLVAHARQAPQPQAPDEVRGVWTHPALQLPGMDAAQIEALDAARAEAAERDIAALRRWWLREMAESPAPLRENLVLFLHGYFGSSTRSVDIAHALHGRNALMRRACLGTVPQLLEQLVLDPAMMIQIGMDEHSRIRMSDRCAMVILDSWTVGPGEYTPADIDNLSRALTGWTLVAAPGHEPAAVPDSAAPRARRRTGLHRIFEPERFDAGAKTILGVTHEFDAPEALAFLARQPATARRFSRHLIAHLGVEDPEGRLEDELVAVYAATDGSIEALLLAVAGSPQFFSADTRWALIKSPAHLLVGACRQLEIPSPPWERLDAWLIAAGQTLFDTPNNGEGRWPGQEDWVQPADRLLVRYWLGHALSGRALPLGFAAAQPGDARPPALPLGASVQAARAEELVARLDPAPGLDPTPEAELDGSLPEDRRQQIVRRILTSPQYQLA